MQAFTTHMGWSGYRDVNPVLTSLMTGTIACTWTLVCTILHEIVQLKDYLWLTG